MSCDKTERAAFFQPAADRRSSLSLSFSYSCSFSLALLTPGIACPRDLSHVSTDTVFRLGSGNSTGKSIFFHTHSEQNLT